MALLSRRWSHQKIRYNRSKSNRGNYKNKIKSSKGFFWIIPASEFNEDRDRINQERLESGEPELTEEELPTATEDEEYYTYGNMAVYRIVEDYDKGIITKKARVYWY